jgi:hypothetical protein
VKHKAIIILTAIAALTLSACSGPNFGTETDNTDIMVPTNVQKFIDEETELQFTFPTDWVHDGELVFRPANIGDSSYVATTIIEDAEVEDLEAYAENAAVGADFDRDEGSELETVVSSRDIPGGRIDEIFILRDTIVVHLYGVFIGLSSDLIFPVDVDSAPSYEPLKDIKVCVGGCNTEIQTPYAKAEEHDFAVIEPEGEDEGDEEEEELSLSGSGEALSLAPSAQPQVQVPQIAPVTISE